MKLPAKFLIDYIRIYQPNNMIEMTCDPIDYPTDEYIRSHSIAYENPNLTSWYQAGFDFPKILYRINVKFLGVLPMGESLTTRITMMVVVVVV